MPKITSYFSSTKNKKYGYDRETQTYYCVECGKEIKEDEKDNKDNKKLCSKIRCESNFIFRIK